MYDKNTNSCIKKGNYQRLNIKIIIDSTEFQVETIEKVC